MKLEKIKFDLWVLVVLMLLIPDNFNTAIDHSGPLKFEIVFFLMSLLIIGLVIWLLKRCGVLIKYRYILIKLNCTISSNRSRYISMCLFVLMVPAYGYLLWIIPLWEFILQCGYLLMSILLCLSYGDVTEN